MKILEDLIFTISRLPGLGPRSARRLVLYLLNKKEQALKLSELLENMISQIITCDLCGNFDIKTPCEICLDPSRADDVLCIVENTGDLWALERSRLYKGKYHVLGGTLSAMNHVAPNHLNINSLKDRIAKQKIKEVILVMSSTIEGETTSHYIADLISDFNLKITKLAHGIPIGADLDYIDEGTLSIAFKARQDF